jgi:hypothetical protein
MGDNRMPQTLTFDEKLDITNRAIASSVNANYSITIKEHIFCIHIII